jgi:hypothetical protein
VTGGGFITVGTSRANFGFNAGFKARATVPEGHLNYIDHNTGMHVKATRVTVYVEGISKTSRHFEGEAELNGVAGFTYPGDPGPPFLFSEAGRGPCPPGGGGAEGHAA